MLSLVARRLARLVVVLAGVSLVTFAILQVSGDPIALMMPEAPEADRAALRQSMGFNDPLAVQFARFVGNIVRGDFGQSFFHREAALPIVLARMPTTLLLTVFAMGLSLALAIPIGIMSAVRRNTAFDHTATLVVFLGTSMPVFWTGIMLILLFAVHFRVLPVSGWESWAALVLPAITLATFSTPLLLRIVRSSMLEVIGLDYVRTARAKGLTERNVVRHHGLPNAMLPVTTIVGLQLGSLFGGAVLTETIFNLSGVGRAVAEAIGSRDFPTVQGFVLVIAIIYLFINLIVDVSYAFLDPRVRLT